MSFSMGKPIEILLVEDNPGDVELTRVAMEDSKLINQLHVVADGEEAMSFLKRRDRYSDYSRPDLIILDLNLPRKDGREVLEEIKKDEELKQIPVVVLTTSGAEEDILKSYNLYANCYIVKPLDFQNFQKVVQNIEKFWVSIVKLPEGNNQAN